MVRTMGTMVKRVIVLGWIGVVVGASSLMAAPDKARVNGFYHSLVKGLAQETPGSRQ